MPLYNNILLSRRGDDGKDKEQSRSNPSASMKMLQDHLLSKRRLHQQDPIVSKYHKSGNSKSSQIISESALHQPSENDWELEDEYDPMVPNNYELLKTELLKAEELRITSSRLKPANSARRINIPNMLDVLDQLEEHEEHEKKPNRSTAIAPPPSLISSVDTKTNSEKQQDKLGQQMDDQGVKKAPELERSDLDTGALVSANKEETSSNPNDDRLQQSTRVILLQNMVGPGEVDEDLEGETKEECKKYGDVSRCLIYEIPNKRVADDKAVRIFVEFKKVESAIKAVNDLNGRFFGGRVVRASFYSVDRFNKYELGPENG